MGQKTHPIGFRLGATRTWSSRWFATKGYAGLLHEDVKIRRFIKSSLYHAGISRIDIERSANRARISIFTARPGIIIGRKGAEVEKLKNEIQSRTAKEVYLNIEEVVHPELDAQLVAENVALQLQKRVAFRRAMKKAVTSALRLGADGIRIARSGRLGGAEIARREWYRDGRVPLHTIRADIDYGLAEPTHDWAIGVKVWIFKGEVPARAASGGGGVSSHVDAQAPSGTGRPARRMKGKAQRGLDARLRHYGLKARAPGG
jgi:small subunit ribosomal protein S3